VILDAWLTSPIGDYYSWNHQSVTLTAHLESSIGDCNFAVIFTDWWT